MSKKKLMLLGGLRYLLPVTSLSTICLAISPTAIATSITM